MKIQTIVVWKNGNSATFSQEFGEEAEIIQVQILDQDGKPVATTEWSAEGENLPRRLPTWEEIAPYITPPIKPQA